VGVAGLWPPKKLCCGCVVQQCCLAHAAYRVPQSSHGDARDLLLHAHADTPDQHTQMQSMTGRRVNAC
jgi:hypothetical protein